MSELYDNFIDEFSSSFNSGDIGGASASIMREIGRLLVNKKDDVVHLLNESGIYADEHMGDAHLIELFVNNIPNNKRLALGTSVLINMNNQKSGFDGKQKVSDGSVKSCYYVIRENFSSVLGSGILGAVGQLAGLGGKIIDNQQKKKTGVIDALQKQKDAKSQIITQALKMKQEQAKAQAAAQTAVSAKEAKSAKTKKIIIIALSSVVGLVVIIGGIIYMRKNK